MLLMDWYNILKGKLSAHCCIHDWQGRETTPSLASLSSWAPHHKWLQHHLDSNSWLSNALLSYHLGAHLLVFLAKFSPNWIFAKSWASSLLLHNLWGQSLTGASPQSAIYVILLHSWMRLEKSTNFTNHSLYLSRCNRHSCSLGWARKRQKTEGLSFIYTENKQILPFLDKV